MLYFNTNVGATLSGLTNDERSSIQAVCASAKYTQGPAAYNRCVASQWK